MEDKSMYMIMFVLDDSDMLDQVLAAWTDNGISGATIIESTGLYRRQKTLIPMRYAYGDTTSDDNDQITIFTIVNDEKAVKKCLHAAEKVVGDLDKPSTGVFTAWPLSITKGIPGK
jgi:nitrogen regulatory protein PII